MNSSPPPTDPADFAAVLATDDLALLAVAKSLLESAGIPYVVQGDHALGLMPVSGPVFGLARPPFQASVLVPKEHADAARELLQSQEERGEPASD